MLDQRTCDDFVTLVGTTERGMFPHEYVRVGAVAMAAENEGMSQTLMYIANLMECLAIRVGKSPSPRDVRANITDSTSLFQAATNTLRAISDTK